MEYKHQICFQILEYLFTDLQIPERFNHASQVYNSFYKRAAALHLWLKKVRIKKFIKISIRYWGLFKFQA